MTIVFPGAEQGGLPDPVPVYTRSGVLIPQERPPKANVEAIKDHARRMREWHPNAIVRSLSAYPYNCVGLIFASRRAWIEIDHIYAILRGDGYRLIYRHEVMAGDLVLYKRDNSPTHVGVIVAACQVHPTSKDLNIQVLSKWGKFGEFLHFVEDVPELFGSPSEFWTERPE